MHEHKIMLATALLALGVASSASAAPVSAPNGLRAAIDDITAVETVHCIPGFVHWHPWGWGTGCYYPQPYYVPRFYGPPIIYPRPRYRVYPRYRRWR